MWQTIKCFFGFHHWYEYKAPLRMQGDGWKVLYQRCSVCGGYRESWAKCLERKDKPHAPPTQHKPGDRVSFEVFGSHYPER